MFIHSRACSLHVACSVPAVCLSIIIGGCQSYEAVPLDIGAHQTVLRARLTDTEPIDAFIDRLSGNGVDVPAEFEPSDGVSLAEGEVLALFYNADLRLARLGAGAALADFETAGLWEDPVFGFDGAEILSSSSPFEYGLTLSLTIPISGRLGVEKDRAGAAYEAELRRVVDAEWSTRARVRGAWAAWSAATERVRMMRELLDQVRRIERLTDALGEAGEISRIESRLFRVESASRRSELTDAVYKSERSRIELLGLIGLPSDIEIELLPEYLFGMVPDDDSLERLIRSNTTLATKRAEYLVAEEKLRLEIRKQYPDLTIGGGYGSEDDDDRLLLGASLPIPFLNGNRGGIAEARAERNTARAIAESTFEDLERELSNFQHMLASYRKQREDYENQIVPLLMEQADEIERVAELGQVDSLLLLETITRQFEAKTRLLRLRVAESQATSSIIELLGPATALSPSPIEPVALNDTSSTQSDESSTGGGL
jgi:outer membrane protein TolC